MRTMLKCALAVALMITASGLSGAARLAERETHQASAAAANDSRLPIAAAWKR